MAVFNDFMHGNIGITSEAVTLKDFMATWLENVVAVNVKPTSLQKYQSYSKKHIVPSLGALKVQKLTPATPDKWLRGRQQTGLSQNTLRHLHTLIRQVLDYAVYPAAYIKVPKNAPRNIIKRTIITPERFAKLLEKYPFGTPYYIPLLLIIRVCA